MPSYCFSFPNPIITEVEDQGMDRDMHTLLGQDWGHDFICVSSFNTIVRFSFNFGEGKEEPIFDRCLLTALRVVWSSC
jgi:hypothetical protein